MSENFHKGDLVELTVHGLAFGGRGVARTEGFVFFVEGALPGQRVEAKITRLKKRFGEAEATKCLEQGPHDIVAFCPHFGKCGGCSFQNLDYAEQLKWKRQFVVDSLSRLGGEEEPRVLETQASPETQEFRNKMEFAFTGGGSGSPLRLGLHKRGSDTSIVNVEHCGLQSKFAMEAVKATREFCAESGIPSYSPITGEGLWRFLVVREGKNTGQTMLHLITAPGPGQAVARALGGFLQERFPELTSFVHSSRKAKSALAFGERTQVALGEPEIEETVLGLNYRISPNSFFQTNTHAAELLYAKARDYAQLTGTETVWDLYCGSGGLSLVMAQKAKSVVGMEEVDSAVKDARINAEKNGLSNCRFLAGDVRKLLAEGTKKPDVVITDPPRRGMHADVVKAIMNAEPKKIVYVSCNPTTLSRDIQILSEKYALVEAQPVDLFPHSAHVECVALLELI
ncbi:23S rRNA (uracil(1939)-C(5))-methyltransferase RlmD [Desulfobaculum bizertense]|uniref:23S rRNA (uracil(1939)-C(5))-methyltransferase RlmD n=1 Tax=Desulfobaculum bizertense TaxID=376490 RepID=UPI001F3C1F67|nr:23S rRNA (uracil(1939)-C(5))-methyltransferase RlmD [Desulfobaculum bizertense]UIJ37203.1 23S rRNA (uracil(1939)-C(5))-methyltransferase RlmD [Desulfobaculum bizertense]